MKVYCDSSVLVKRVVLEPDSEHVADVLEELCGSGATLVTSDLARVELLRALRRRAGEAQSVDSLVHEALADAVIVDLFTDCLTLAGSLPIENLRTLDAIHLATAMVAGCDVVLTRDRQMARACTELGLDVA